MKKIFKGHKKKRFPLKPIKTNGRSPVLVSDTNKKGRIKYQMTFFFPKTDIVGPYIFLLGLVLNPNTYP